MKSRRGFLEFESRAAVPESWNLISFSSDVILAGKWRTSLS